MPSRGASFPGLFAAAALFATGCEARLTVGAPCVRASECPAPLACLLGRCREECRDHRDCPLSTRCVFGDAGLGSCTLADDVCDLERPCADGLVCVSGDCFDPCAGEACPAGGVCSRGLCLRAGPLADGGGATSFPPHRGCTTATDCEPGALCTEQGGGSRACRRPCSTNAECDAADATGACQTSLDPDGVAVLACSEPCDLFTDGGCLDGEACDVVGANGPLAWTVAIDCRGILGTAGRQGDACPTSFGARDQALCAPGFTCGDGAAGPTCFALCTTSGAYGPPCPAGTVCAPLGARYHGALAGACVPP